MFFCFFFLFAHFCAKMDGMRGVSIKIKVFLLLLLISSVLIGVMALLMQIEFNRGFEQYKQSVERSFNHRVVKTLEWFYRKNHSWERLRDNPRHWYHLLNRSGFKATKRLHFKLDGELIDELKDKESLRSFMPSYSLFDEKRLLVVGELSWPETQQTAVKILPLRHRGEVVGYLLSDGQQVATLTQDRMFNAHIRHKLLVMALVMLLLSTVLTIPITNYLSRPIEAVNEAVKRAALGDYSVNVEVNRSDEVGQMARNINRLNETLRSNVELQKNQMAEIAHELRTPIAVILAEIEAIQDGVHQANSDNIDLLHDQIFNLRNIVNDLYDLSISEQGALRYRMEHVDLLPLVEQILTAHKATFEQRQLNVSLICREDSITAYADQQRFRQLLSNILSNSIKYTAVGGEVQLHLRQTDEFVEISVADSAPGLDASQMEQIFQRFYRQAEHQERGSGLGLAIAKNIVKAHHGTIVAEAAELGGIVIHIKLPRTV